MLSYNTDYYWYNEEDDRFYKVRLKMLHIDGHNLFDIVEVAHNGWRINQKEVETEPVIININFRDFDTVLDYLIIKKMCSFGRVGPFFEHDKQVKFYEALYILLEKYPDQYMKYITETFDDELYQSFQRLSLYNTT